MFFRLFLLFTITPLIELFILVRLGMYVGFWPTVGVVVVTGAIGSVLARVQGTTILRRIRSDFSMGMLPTDKLIDGLLILIAGALLITPGLITDFVGFLLLVPWSRHRLVLWVKRKFKQKIEGGQVTVHTNVTEATWHRDEM